MEPLIDNNITEQEESNKPTIKHLSVLIGYLLLFMFFAFYSAGEPVFYDLENESMLLLLKVSQFISVLLIFALPAFLFAQFCTTEKSTFLKLNVSFNLKSAIIVGILFICATPTIGGIAKLNELMSFPEFLSSIENWMRAAEENAKILTEAFLQMNSISDLFINLFVIAFMAAFTEELFFRGALQGTLIKVTKNIHLSIWIAAFLFSAIHGQFYGFIPRILLGALLGYLFTWSGSIWVPIIGHFVNNGFAVVISWFIQQGVLPEDLETVEATAIDFTLIGISIVLTTVLIFIIKRQLKFANSTNEPEHL